MPVVTPLARNVLLAGGATAAVAASGTVTGCLQTAVVGLLSLAAAVCATPKPKDPKMTTMDRFMVNLQRILQGKLPLGHVAAVLRIEKDAMPDASTGKECMAKVAAAFPRFGAVPVQDKFVELSYWETCRDMDWSYHIVEHPAVKSESELLGKVNELINTKLDASKPAWVIDIVPSAAGQGAVLYRLDHCMADGLRFMKAAKGFFSFKDGSPAELSILKALSAKKIDASSKMGRGPSFFLRAVKDFFKVLALEKLPAEDASCFHAPKTFFEQPCKYATVTSSVKLSDIKAIRTHCPAGTTINDIVLTAFCGALRRYSADCGEELKPDQLMRAFCAVALPDLRDREEWEIYNNFVMPSFELPVGKASTAERLAEANKTMSELKVSLTGPVMTALSAMLGRLGLDALAGESQMKVFPNHSFVYSNVPGFDQPVYLFGGGKHKIESFECYYPNMVSQLLFLSYCDKLTCSLTTDPRVVSKPQALVDAFVKEVAEWHSTVC